MSQTATAVKWLNASQAAERYGLSLRHFLRCVDRGDMPKGTHFGKSVRWAVDALDEHDRVLAEKSLAGK